MQSVNRHGTTPTQPQTDDTDTQNTVGKGADANPYLALAAVLAGILHGITKHPMLPDPCTGDAYEADPLTGPVPRTLDDAVAEFAEGSLATHAFSPSVVQHYTHAARTEIEADHGQVTDVDRARGFFHA
ncbi:hypothetical protein ABZ402_38380 [Streptomyces mirabilis]|uniref:hypothetical protein n=1 Tax=Streptomyces mirabilis TaxID=68239 RepID=UPI0033E14E1B